MRTQRNGALTAVLAVLVGVLSLVLPALAPTHVASAHGGMTSPATRTYVCYQENPESPDTDVCRDAVAQGGTQPLYDWFAVLISNAAGRHRTLIPDGQLCGAATTKYAPYNMARDDWPATTLQSGSQFTFRYNAWAPHPGTFDLYVTRDGYDPNQPLKWSDLEPAPFLSVTNPPIVGGDYTWTGQLPPSKNGRHLIYSIWQRSDSPEAFYNCSDVIFTGGRPDTAPPTVPGAPTASAITGSTVQLTWPASTDDVGVSGYRVYREAGATDVLVASSTTNSATITGLTPQTGYTFYVVATDAAGHTSAASTPVTVRTTTEPDTGPCEVRYTTPTKWFGGFTGNVRITNTATVPLEGWTVEWTFGGDQKVTSGWSAQVSQTGTRVTARNVDWNRIIAAGASAEFGFNASSSASDPAAPAVFTLNGRNCAVR